MRKSTVLFGTIAALLSVILLIGCAKPAPAPTSAPAPTTQASAPTPTSSPKGSIPQKISLTFNTVLAKTHPIFPYEEAFAKNVSDRTKGGIEVKVFPAQTLGIQGPKALEAVRDGVVDISEVWGTHVSGVEPVMAYFGLYGLFPLDARQNLLLSLRSDYGALLLKKYNQQLLAFTMAETRLISSRKPAPNLDSLKGLKIRAEGPEEAMFSEKLGMVPTTIDYGELYSAIERGTVDALWTTSSTFLSSKFYEVAKYGFDSQAGGATYFLTVNKAVWDKLPAEYQKIIESAARDELQPTISKVWWEQLPGENAQKLKDKGVQISTLSPADTPRFLAAGTEVAQKWKAGITDSAAKQIIEKTESLIKK